MGQNRIFFSLQLDIVVLALAPYKWRFMAGKTIHELLAIYLCHVSFPEGTVVWVNLITTSLFSLTGIMANKGHHPLLWPEFMLVRHWQVQQVVPRARNRAWIIACFISVERPMNHSHPVDKKKPTDVY